MCVVLQQRTFAGNVAILTTDDEEEKSRNKSKKTEKLETMATENDYTIVLTPTVLPDGNGGFTPCPELLTEDELVRFLRIPQISNSKDHHNVIEHLKRYRDLPRIHICNKVLYPTQAIQKWIERETTNGN